MGLYADGKTSAINTLKAAIDTYTVTQADGSKALDRAGLASYLVDVANTVISSDVSAPNQQAAAAVLASINAVPQFDALENTISRKNWETRADWPATAAIVQAAALTGAVTSAKASMDAAAAAISQYYANLSDHAEEVIDRIWYELGIDASLPATIPRVVENRCYIVTYLTDWYEEGAPSPASDLIECDQDDVTTITRNGSIPSGRNITGWRLYRSQATTNGAVFQLVADKAAAGAVLVDGEFSHFSTGTTTYVDSYKAEELQETCPSATWTEPPSNLRGLVGMPNGIMAGFFENTVCFSEPWRPHAWPVEYQITCESKVNALGVFGQTLVVSHDSGVNFISGSDSASMSMQKNVSRQVCASPRSMVNVDAGVVYASSDGVCLASSSGVTILTMNHFARQDWQALTPSSIVGGYHDGTYFFLAAGICYSLNLADGKLSTLTLTGSAFYTDHAADKLFIASGNSIKSCFTENTYRTGTWKSKKFTMPKQATYAWLAVQSDFTAPVTVKWYGDGVLVHTTAVSSVNPVRLPAGRFLEHEVEVSSSGRWSAVILASSGDEIRGA